MNGALPSVWVLPPRVRCPYCGGDADVGNTVFLHHVSPKTQERCEGTGLSAKNELKRAIFDAGRRTAFVQQGMKDALADGTALSERARDRMTQYIQRLDEDLRARRLEMCALGALRDELQFLAKEPAWTPMP